MSLNLRSENLGSGKLTGRNPVTVLARPFQSRSGQAYSGLPLMLYSITRQSGFTLIEMMVVLTIMAVTMTVLLKATSGQQDQVRYNRTVERYNMIKQAILNVSNVNGVPVITGFAADMGRLPRNIHELMAERFCRGDVAGTVSACKSGGMTDASPWLLKAICSDGSPQNGQAVTCSIPTCPDGSPQNGHQATCNINISTPTTLTIALNGGWHGPYLQTSQNPTNVDGNNCADAFTDGWGNMGFVRNSNRNACPPYDDDYPDKRHNYGWYFNPNKNPDDSYNTLCNSTQGDAACLTVFSYGNGCYKEADLCKGTNALPDIFDFTYPLSASPQANGLIYDLGQNNAITPNLAQTTEFGLSSPTNVQPTLPPPLIKPDDWQVNIGNTGVGVLVASKSCKAGLDCTGTISQLCLNIYYLTNYSNLSPPPVYPVMAVVSGNGSIPEDGLVHSVPFVFIAGTAIPVTNAAISVHTGPCSSAYGTPLANGTNTPTYPLTIDPKTNLPINRPAVPVKILPGQIPSFVW
jgi:prepilin-type N-terminal cleavage/methylation domain-containing protein